MLSRKSSVPELLFVIPPAPIVSVYVRCAEDVPEVPARIDHPNVPLREMAYALFPVSELTRSVPLAVGVPIMSSAPGVPLGDQRLELLQSAVLLLFQEYVV